MTERGDEVVRLVRSGGGDRSSALWDPLRGLLEPGPVDGVDALVHLAGLGIADRRWSEARKEALVSSRVEATRRLVESCARLERPPARFLCASAIGFYGDRGDEHLDETSSAGVGFLANLCTNWERQAATAREWADRVYTLRTGIVLATGGGALAKMMLPFKMGVGGVLGSGTQYMSWISIDDEVGAILHLLEADTESGPVNLTAPAPVTNREFTRSLGAALGRPTVLPMPGLAVSLLFGEMGREALLGSQRVAPIRLEGSDYEFTHPALDEALDSLLA